LLKKNAATWIGCATGFPAVGNYPFIGFGLRQVTTLGHEFMPCEFSRGWISHVTCSWADWTKHAAVIREEHPVKWVTLTEGVFAPSSDGFTPAQNGWSHYDYPGIEFWIRHYYPDEADHRRTGHDPGE
jgi:hypothetical protein